MLKRLIRRVAPGFTTDLSRALVIGKALDTPMEGPRRRTQNLKRFLDVLAGLRRREHIAEFGRIHELVLAKAWGERNAAYLLQQRYAAELCETAVERLRASEYKVYSQNGEDGVILYLFSRIGWGPKTAFNIGGGGVSSNTANLIRYWGWRSVEVDASEASLKAFEATHMGGAAALRDRVRLRAAWVTRENVNDLAVSNGLEGEIGLLSIDIDGNDYWVWEALEAVRPRVVVIEYNAFFGAERSITVPYDPAFDRSRKHPSGWYMGASLRALAKLGAAKGYALVGCESNGVNAFFVRTDLLRGDLEAVSPEAAYYPHFQAATRMDAGTLEAMLTEMPFVEI